MPATGLRKSGKDRVIRLFKIDKACCGRKMLFLGRGLLEVRRRRVIYWSDPAKELDRSPLACAKIFSHVASGGEARWISR